jgi:phosphate transport system ATP-binding protein
MEKAGIAARGVDLWYGEHRALSDVTLEVAPNSVCALIGPSGCGKSTLLKTFNRMHDGDVKVEGSFELLGSDMAGMDALEVRARVGMVFQRPAPFTMSVYENVAYPLRARGMKSGAEMDAIVEKCLVGANLWDEVKNGLKKSGRALSGGQAQRLCIARTLAAGPDVILMDEPTSALDPVSSAQIEELVRELAREATVVAVTHNMQQAARVADTTAFMLGGRMVECAPTAELFGAPKMKETHDYLTGRFG